MRRTLPFAALFAAAAALVATAAPAGAVHDGPLVIPIAQGEGASASWEPGVGQPDSGLVGDKYGLVLAKRVRTSKPSAALALVNDLDLLLGQGKVVRELGFDYRSDTHCGAGAPRFNVVQKGRTYFFGCLSGDHSPVPGQPKWTRVRFDPSDAVPANPSGKPFSDGKVESIMIVMDEGTDITGQGTPGKSILDNIDLNGKLVGEPLPLL